MSFTTFDFIPAITANKFNPTDFDLSYGLTAKIKQKLGDNKGAIATLNLGIQNNPKNSTFYGLRGLLRAENGDKEGAILDYKQAAKLFQQEGNTEQYQLMVEVLKKLSEI